MKTWMMTAVGLALAVSASMAQAKMDANEIAAAQALFSGSGCTACHSPADTLVGPALKDIAKRYKGKQAEAEDVNRIREGSSGRWGDGMHPANGAIEPEDARRLAKWILNGAP